MNVTGNVGGLFTNTGTLSGATAAGVVIYGDLRNGFVNSGSVTDSPWASTSRETSPTASATAAISAALRQRVGGRPLCRRQCFGQFHQHRRRQHHRGQQPLPRTRGRRRRLCRGKLFGQFRQCGGDGGSGLRERRGAQTPSASISARISPATSRIPARGTSPATTAPASSGRPPTARPSASTSSATSPAATSPIPPTSAAI